MALFKRKELWWIDIRHNGERIRKSTGTKDKLAALEYHDRFKADLWRQVQLKEKPDKSWIDAVMRWLDETSHKRSRKADLVYLNWLDQFLRSKKLNEIDGDLIEQIARIKDSTGVKPATVNRILEVLRAILRKAHFEWNWLDKIPTVRMRYEGAHRVRWLTPKEAKRLLGELPKHLRDMAEFTLATGLRDANVTGLRWDQVNLVQRHALIHPDQAKTKKAIPVPLNKRAIDVIKQQLGQHATFVFTYKGRPVSRCNNHAWRKALARAGIENFRWHDLRHTWASWHVQNGTSLHELQQLGGWSNYEMVLRYAHLSSDHLKEAADRLDTKLSQEQFGFSDTER